MAGLDGILLDIDGTLLTTGDAITTAATAGFASVWPHLVEQQSKAAGDRFRRDPGGWFGRYARGEMAFDQMRQERFAEVAAWLGVEVDTDSHQRYAEVYDPGLAAAITAFEDVEPALRSWRADGLRVGALTNASQRMTTAKLASTGLGDAFDVVVTADTLGFGKPDPRVFHHACEALGTVPARTAYVGDDLEADALGSRDAGLRSYWLVREAAPTAVPDQVVVLVSLTDLGPRPASR